MSSVVRKLRVVDGEVREVTAAPPAGEKRLGAAYGDANPLVSVAFSCHREQVEEYRDHFRHLTGVRWRDDGTCEITDRGDCGRRGLLKATRRHDSDGGYGDG